MAEPPKKETISEKEFKAEEAERERRFNAMLGRIKCVATFASSPLPPSPLSKRKPPHPAKPRVARGRISCFIFLLLGPRKKLKNVNLPPPPRASP
jgi:hypothetical protein